MRPPSPFAFAKASTFAKATVDETVDETVDMRPRRTKDGVEITSA